jgi:hypothetical protein
MNVLILRKYPQFIFSSNDQNFCARTKLFLFVSNLFNLLSDSPKTEMEGFFLFVSFVLIFFVMKHAWFIIHLSFMYSFFFSSCVVSLFFLIQVVLRPFYRGLLFVFFPFLFFYIIKNCYL